MSPQRGIPLDEIIVGQNNLPSQVLTSGRYYRGATDHHGGAVLTINTIDRVWAWTWWLAETTRFDRIGVNVTTAQASANARVGVYDSDEAGYPENLVVESASLDTSTTGVKETTIDVLMRGPARYWAGVVTDVSAVAFTIDGAGQIIGLDTPGKQAQNNIWVAHTFAALPDPYGTVNVNNNPFGGQPVTLRAL